jgi:hypothetical protein
MTGRLLIVLLTRSTVVIVHAVVHPPQLSSSLPWFRRGGRRHSVVVVISAVVVLSSSLRSWRLLQCRALAVREVTRLEKSDTAILAEHSTVSDHCSSTNTTYFYTVIQINFESPKYKWFSSNAVRARSMRRRYLPNPERNRWSGSGPEAEPRP